MTFYEISTPSGSTRSPVFTFVMYILMLIQSTQIILCKLDLCICAHLSSSDCIRQKDGGNNVEVESRICSNSTAHVRSRMTASCLYLTLNNFCNVSSVPIQDSSVKQLCLKDAKDFLAVILPFPSQSYSKRSILSEVSFMTQF